MYTPSMYSFESALVNPAGACVPSSERNSVGGIRTGAPLAASVMTIFSTVPAGTPGFATIAPIFETMSDAARPVASIVWLLSEVTSDDGKDSTTGGTTLAFFLYAPAHQMAPVARPM